MPEQFRLQRFIDAQRPIYRQVCSELRAGHKSGHWMWFIFPQVAGLGHSEMARRFAISGLNEAASYLAHPILGERLLACSKLVAELDGHTIHDIFGTPDDMKFGSSMTLFAQAAPGQPVFAQCLEKYFGGQPDRATLDRLRAQS